MISKKGFEFSFGWLFAIIAGAVIIFLAIYFASKFIATTSTYQNAKLGKEFEIILNPLETGLEIRNNPRMIKMPVQTTLYNKCESAYTIFGYQEIGLLTESSIQTNEEVPLISSSFQNKYLFSSDSVKGKTFYVFSKQLLMPYKIADLIYLWSENERYCFVNPPNQIEDEIESLAREGIGNINVTSSKCSDGINVCFSSFECDIDVSLDISGKIRGSLKKQFEDRVYFSNDALFYAAVFSTTDIYECNLKRLMKRASELAHIYRMKSELLTAKGCTSPILAEGLIDYSQKTFLLNNSQEIISIGIVSDELRRINDGLSCRLF